MLLAIAQNPWKLKEAKCCKGKFEGVENNSGCEDHTE